MEKVLFKKNNIKVTSATFDNGSRKISIEDITSIKLIHENLSIFYIALFLILITASVLAFFIAIKEENLNMVIVSLLGLIFFGGGALLMKRGEHIILLTTLQGEIEGLRTPFNYEFASEVARAIEGAKSLFKEQQQKLYENKKINEAQLLILKEEFKKLFLNSESNEFIIPSIEIFDSHLKNHQQEIAKFDQSWIHDLVKIKPYLQSANDSITSNFQQTLQEEDLDYFKQMQTEVVKQIEAYDKVYGNALILIDSIIENNHVLSYEIYEIFDKLGFFESNWEQRLIQKFEDLNNSINQINSNIEKINEQFEEITNANISKMGQHKSSLGFLEIGMPLLSLYGGYKLGYHLFGAPKKHS